MDTGAVGIQSGRSFSKNWALPFLFAVSVLFSACGGGTADTTGKSDNNIPISDAGNDQVVSIGSMAILNGSKSSDQDGTALTYEWSFISMPDKSNAVIPDPTTARPTFAADVEGTYTIALVVNDGEVDSSQDIVNIKAVINNNRPPDSYAHGEVIVGFNDSVTEREADDLVKLYGLTWASHFPRLFYYWVKVLDDSEINYLEQISNNEIVLWAKERRYSQGEPGFQYILVQFNVTATEESAHELINSFANLEVASIILAPTWGLINVNDGTEQYWVYTFENNMDIVKYAQLNYIMILY